jgi:hypothetical protein
MDVPLEIFFCEMVLRICWLRRVVSDVGCDRRASARLQAAGMWRWWITHRRLVERFCAIRSPAIVLDLGRRAGSYLGSCRFGFAAPPLLCADKIHATQCHTRSVHICLLCQASARPTPTRPLRSSSLALTMFGLHVHPPIHKHYKICNSYKEWNPVPCIEGNT